MLPYQTTNIFGMAHPSVVKIETIGTWILRIFDFRDKEGKW